MHDDHDDHVRTKSSDSLSTGDVNDGGDEVNFKLYRANNIEPKFLNNLPISIQPHKENPSSSSSKCYDNTSMAHPKPHTYYNSQTGTSIIHISSNSSVSNTVRENSNYIERQWAILKEKMLPTTKSNPKPEVDHKAVVSEFVEERCEVDFSFIDEPNGNEPDNNYAKNLDLFKSKDMSSNPSNKIDSNNSLRCVNDLKNDFRHTDGSIPSLSASMQVSNEPQILLNKSEVTTASLNLSKDKPDTLRHSFVEKLNKDHNTDNIVRKSLTLEPPLLVPSYRDDFLYNRDSTHLRSDKVFARKYDEFSSLKSSQNENVNFYNTMSVPSSNCEVKANSVDEIDCPPSHDSNEADQDELKNSEMKSKKYQEMHSRKLKKQERQKNSFQVTGADQMPDYKGDKSLEDIINFINKDIKEASTIVPQKTNKKLKKKTVKKDSISFLLNGIESQKMELCPTNLEERSEKVNDKAVECHGNISVQLNSESCESSSSVSKNCSEEQEFRPVLFENKVELSGPLKNSIDNEHFSVVKKKKKSKKSVDHSKESHSEKLLGSDSSFIESVVDHIGPSLDLCSKTLKNKSNMNTKESISIAESNIPKSRDCQSFTKASEDLKPLKNESRATSNNVTDKFDSIETRPTELCKSRQICKKNAENASVSSWKCSDVISFLSKPDDFPPIKPIVPLNTKEITENIMAEVGLIHPRKPNSLFSLSKSKSAFNLKHAQAFMNSTYQEVIKSKGYVLYNQNI